MPVTRTQPRNGRESREKNPSISFTRPVPAYHHLTDYLRWFCSTHRPEVNSDDAFQPRRPGVYGRDQARFSFDYADAMPNRKGSQDTKDDPSRFQAVSITPHRYLH